MAIREINTHPTGHPREPAPTVCLLCGQSLTGAKLIDRYLKNLKAYDAGLMTQVRDEARAEIRAEYARNEKARAAELEAKAEERAHRAFDRRTRQMEQNNQSLQRQLDIAKRQLERLSSVTRGSCNEEELLAALTHEFPEDRIERIGRGPAGRGDILHSIRSGRTAAGLIVYECKDTARWDNAFITQARTSRDHHQATHALLVTTAFPPKHDNGIAVIEGVAVVSASSMLPLVHILRDSMVRLAKAELSAEGRRAKSEALLRYLASEEFRSEFTGAVDAVGKLQRSLDKERHQHDRTWAERAGNYRRIDAGMAEIDAAITAIVEQPADEVSVLEGSRVPEVAACDS